MLCHTAASALSVRCVLAFGHAPGPSILRLGYL